MILVFGVLDDPETAYVCSRLLSRRLDFILMDTRLSPRQLGLTWGLRGGQFEGTLGSGAKQRDLREVRSMYVRPRGTVQQPQASPDAAQEQEKRAYAAGAESSCAFVAFANSVPALVVNRPAASNSNGSKPYQQQVIARHGFAVPRTVVTTVPEEARRFYEKCRGRVIYKSISAQRSIVRRLTSDDLERLHQVRVCPTQFQEYIPGVDVRVHTIGDRIFATEIVTEAMDYRYAAREGAAREMRPVDLPPAVAERCQLLTRALGLVIGGVDLRRSPDGQYYCFEVNPSPAFTFYQAHTGQRIGDALIDLLSQGATERRS
jgi:glutathione synthase/RimK-type ligase-like ATP-grasp enzyme